LQLLLGLWDAGECGLLHHSLPLWIVQYSISRPSRTDPDMTSALITTTPGSPALWPSSAPLPCKAPVGLAEIPAQITATPGTIDALATLCRLADLIVNKVAAYTASGAYP
jgi:hypothetical protein